MKKIIAIAATALTLCSAMAAPITSTISNGNTVSTSFVQMLEADAASGRLYNQNDKSWSSELRSAGCGLFSTANAIYALNGNKMDINSFASWAKSMGYWKPGIYGTDRSTLYPNITAKYGSQYGFKVVASYSGKVTDSTLTNHLKNGGVAVAHVGTPGVNGHFIALTGYNGKYHVIDSVSRCAGSSGDAWQDAAFLSNTANQNNTRVDWYCLISKATQTTSNSTSCFPKYTGSSVSISEALKSLGYDGSYDYRCQIAAANNISNYSGTPSQNTTMLNSLKAGTLKKPGSSTVTYFKKYTGSSVSISEALKSLGYDGSYDYRCKIASVNNISNYSGTPAQNTTMLNLLKNGKLIKP